MRFDHLVHWVPERAAGVAAYEAAGFHVAMGGEHPGWGTHNALSHFGLGYSEIIAQHDPSANLPPILERGPAMLAQGGGAGNFAVAVPDLAAASERLRARGLPVSEGQLGQRLRPDGTLLHWQTATFADGPEWRPFLIQWGQSDDERLADLQARGISAPHALGYLRLDHLVVTCPDPASDADWLGRLVGVQPQPQSAGAAAWRVPLAGGDVVLLAGAGVPQVARLVLNGGRPARAKIFGVELVVGA